jgi:hypothetical protein
MRRKVSAGVKAYFARKKAGKLAVVRTGARSVARRFSRPARRSVSRFGGGGSISMKSIFSKPMLTTVGGAIGAGFLTNLVLGKWGASLPMINSPIGSIAWRLIIPVGGAYIVRKKNRQLAEGMIIGGLVMAVTEAIRLYMPQAQIAGVPIASQSTAVGEYLGGAGYDSVNTFGAPSIYESEAAFKDSAWN